MWASAGMVMMNTKVLLCGHYHRHTRFGKEDAPNHFMVLSAFLQSHGSNCMGAV